MYQFDEARPTTHFLHDVAKGNIWDSKPLNVFGFNRNIGGVYEPIWNNSGSYTFPSSGLIMSLVSTSASDTMSVLINGLDINHQIITETVTLTGTVAVQTSLSFYRINSAVILSGLNVGNISISNGGTVYGFIEADSGTTQAAIYTVPENHSLYLFRIDVLSATANPNKFITFRNVVTSSLGRTLKVAEATFATSQVSFDRQVPFVIGEKSDFLFEAKSSSGENEVSIFIETILVRNS
jgi:hypothetical protein